MTTSPPPSRPPLPILKTVAAAYRSLIENVLPFLHAAGGWYVLTLAVTVGLGTLAQTDAQHQVAMAASLLAQLTATVAVAVSWHRLVLLGEQPQGPLPIRFGPWRAYLARSLILAALGAALGALASAGVWFSGSVEVAGIGFIAGYVGAFLIIGRLLLIFPAAAIGERRMTVKASWAFTIRNSWRMFAGLSLAVVPVVFLFALAAMALANGRRPELMVPFSLALSFVNLALAAGFASFAYRHFTQGATPV